MATKWGGPSALSEEDGGRCHPGVKRLQEAGQREGKKVVRTKSGGDFSRYGEVAMLPFNWEPQEK